MRILVIEDSERLRRSLATGLRKSGYAVDLAADGAQGLWSAQSNSYDVIVLDLMLPEVDGLSVLQTLRGKEINSHVLILTAKDSVEDRVRGLRLGADDYLVKPFAFSELLARVRSVLRRSQSVQSPEQLRIHDLEIDTRRHKACRAGAPLNLTSKEFLLLAHLVRNAGEVVSRNEIANQIWDIDFPINTNVVDVMVRRLRAKVDDPFKEKLVRTIRGVGYVLKSD